MIIKQLQGDNENPTFAIVSESWTDGIVRTTAFGNSVCYVDPKNKTDKELIDIYNQNPNYLDPMTRRRIISMIVHQKLRRVLI